MNWKPLLKIVFVSALAGATTWAAALELGQVRSQRRGWVQQGPRSTQELPEAVVEQPVVFTSEPDLEQAEPRVAEAKTQRRAKKLPKQEAGPGLIQRGLILIGRGEKAPSLADGYLTVAAPPALRFSDKDPVNARPVSPALPEFNFSSREYMPYLIETDLSEEELEDAAMLSEIVIELAPHEVVSGMIDTRRRSQEELVENFDLEEQRTTVLRPEEVLIYFETDTGSGRTGAMVPFSPATPSANPTVKSSATFKKE